MTQARHDAPQTAAFARRVVCRALTVVGGVAAGTALTWLLSTGSTSAETLPPIDDVRTAVGAVTVPVSVPVTAPVEQAAEAVVQHLPDPPPPPKEQLANLGEKIKGTAEQLRGQTDRAVPDCGVCLIGERHDYTPGSFGRSNIPTTPALVPVASTIAPAVVVDARTPHTAKDRAFADGMSRRGSPAPVEPALPGLPGWPAPLVPTPAGVPTTGNHGSAGNAADSHVSSALPWQDRTTDLVGDGTAATTDGATYGRPGSQPGVAPD